MIFFYFILWKQKWRKYLLILYVLMLEMMNFLFFLNNVVFEFNFYFINNFMCFLLKKNKIQMLLLGFILKKLNYYVIVFVFVSNNFILLN